MRRLLCVLLVSSWIAAAQTEQEWMSRGIQAYKNAQYAEATAAFQRAVELNSSNVQGWLYLGTAEMQQYIPGSDVAEVLAHADAAASAFQRAVDLDNGQQVALASLGTLSLQRKRWEEARGWYRRLQSLDPSDKTTYYSLAFSVWAGWYPVYSQARTALGMRPEARGPIADAAVRQRLQTQWGPALAGAIADLRRALELDPDFSDAMAYLNLLIRERADLVATVGEYEQEIAEADQWVGRAIAARTKQPKAEAGFGRAPAPPPPPPPPPGSATAPQRVQVGSAMAASLIRKVDPLYPNPAREARIEGAVRLMAVIGKDGNVAALDVMSGHPLLIPAALDAVKQWVYRPTLLNGEPVEVRTEIEINFRLPN